MAKVTSRQKDPEGNLIRKAAAHPILDTREYVVEFPGGSEAEYAANIIAKNLLSQCGSEQGRQHLLVNHIVDHLKGESAIEKADAYLTLNDRQVRKKTTKGWKRCVEWNEGSTSWVPLATLKEQIPMEIAEYATIHGIADEPAFAWWVPWTPSRSGMS
jgi:hypothetical protein